MTPRYSYDRSERVAGSGWLSWKQVDELSHKFNGTLDKDYKSKSEASQDTRWKFKSKGDWNMFVEALQKNKMTFKGDPRTMMAVVWF